MLKRISLSHVRMRPTTAWVQTRHMPSVRGLLPPHRWAYGNVFRLEEAAAALMCSFRHLLILLRA